MIDIRPYIPFVVIIGAAITLLVLLYRQQISIWHKLQHDFNLSPEQKIDIRYYLSEFGWRSMNLYLPVGAEMYILNHAVIIMVKPKSLLAFNLVTMLPVIITKSPDKVKTQTTFWRIVKPEHFELFGKRSIIIDYFDLYQTKRKLRITASILDENKTDVANSVMKILG